MNRGKGSLMRSRIGGQYGYTIIELMIFLAVSALLFGSTMALLSGKQARTQFSNSVSDFETKLLDIANDVSNGYYQSSGNVSCSKSGSGSLDISSTATDLGKNIDCILLGRVIKLGMGTGDANEQYGIYSLVGLRQNSAQKDVVSLGEANPVLLLTNNPVDTAANQSLVSAAKFGYGATVDCVVISPATCSGSKNNALIAFVTKLTGGVQSTDSGGAITTDVYYHEQARIDAGAETLSFQATEFKKLSSGQTLTICVKSGTTDQYALVSITNSRIVTQIKSGGTCS